MMRIFYITSVCIIMMTLIFVMAVTAYAKKIGAASHTVEDPPKVLLMDTPGCLL
ncbi:MAG TPA: hypothetical protein PLY40_01130 [Bacillota bacterium]|nr:hypothetical protein [Bacillota bacterium]